MQQGCLPNLETVGEGGEMSTTYDIMCKDCGKSLWIAQSSQSAPVVPMTFYSGDEKCMEALRVFLHEHMGHSLLFGIQECYEEMGQFKEAP